MIAAAVTHSTQARPYFANMAFPIILIFSLFRIESSYGAQKSVVSLSTLDNCVERSVVDNYMQNMETIQYGRETRVNGDFIANVIIRNNSRQTLTFLKCTDREGKGCEHFIVVKLPQFCRGLTKKQEVWTPFYHASTPPFECPIQGVYRFRNATLNMAKVTEYTANVPTIMNHFWKVQVRVFVGSKIQGCVEFILKIDRVKM